MALLSGSGKQMKRIEYVYTDQDSHSLGSALLLTDYYFLMATAIPTTASSRARCNI
jgi:hypothetical protein